MIWKLGLYRGIGFRVVGLGFSILGFRVVGFQGSRCFGMGSGFQVFEDRVSGTEDIQMVVFGP